jgi:ABC-2 type transport system ATP-binding protein
MNAIEIAGFSKTYKGKKGARVEALKDLSLSVGQGEIFGFLGPNGAGKSTTIKALLGLITPSGGSASIMGVSSKSHLSRLKVGYLPENPAFYDYLSGEEYLGFVGRSYRMPEPLLKERSESVLKLMDLWEVRRRPLRGYSKGMVQRLGLAQVLLHDPDVYILDEPMSGLDPIGRALVKDIMLDLKRRGKCVFFSTHITSDVESVCDRVGILLHGVLQSVERVETIMTKGIVGYTVRSSENSTGAVEELFVTKEQIGEAVAGALAAGRQITLVEPKRKNLEEFFLDIVHGRS